jgi:outer membrane protein
MLWAAVGAVSAAVPARADTLEWAIVLAYQNNPSLNAQRAALRAVDPVIDRNSASLQLAASITSTRSTKRSTNKSFRINPSTAASPRTCRPGNSAPPRRKRFSTDFKPPIAHGKQKAR